MMNDNGMSVADVAALSGNGGFGGWGNGFEGLIYLAVIASMFGGGWGGFGGFGGNAAGAAFAGNLATQNDLQQAFNYSNLLDGNRDIANLVTNGAAQTVAATNQTFHDTLAALTDKYSELARDIAAVQVGQANALANQNECCCNTRMAISENAAGINANIAQARYDDALNTAAINANIAQAQYQGAMNTAAINENTTAVGQKIIDAITGNRMADMQNQINQLELQNQLASVVRYPSNTFYSVPSPCFNACGCGNI